MGEELDQKIFNYIAALERTNEELVKALKYCVELLTQFKSSVPDPNGWQKMLDALQETINAGERIVGERTLHQLESSLAEKLDERELVSFEELLRANMIQTDAVTQLLVEKGIITEEEFYTKLKQG